MKFAFGVMAEHERFIMAIFYSKIHTNYLYQLYTCLSVDIPTKNRPRKTHLCRFYQGADLCNLISSPFSRDSKIRVTLLAHEVQDLWSLISSSPSRLTTRVTLLYLPRGPIPG